MEANHTFNEGTHVKHISKLTEGRILGVTRIRSLFEDPKSVFEYRVQTREGIKIYSPANLEVQNVNDSAVTSGKSQDRTATGRDGVKLVCDELTRLGYKCVVMPDNNPGFDIACHSPEGAAFKVEVKYSKAGHADVHLQIRSHLESKLQSDLFYVFLRPMSDVNPWLEFSVMTHGEVQAAWAKQPRVKPDGTPYVINGTGYIEWKHLTEYLNNWNKLPS
ncbi:MAG: hypothetical protein ND895_00885 [Pyrinomonadaceae bacterium]|nr:hypothetical protein [Pyrinomonadaceae bacterium]